MTITQKLSVEKLVTLIYEINPQIVVAIGGGTAIDLAKQACLLSRLKKESVKNQITTNSYKSIDNVIPLIAIPTTAGTGSESTKFAVIYIDGIKHSVEHNLMIPKYIILDPNLLSGCPKQIVQAQQWILSHSSYRINLVGSFYFEKHRVCISSNSTH